MSREDLPADTDVYLSSAQVRAKFNITEMTLWRWMDSDRIAFPRPIYIGARRYWKLSEMEAWEAERADSREADAEAMRGVRDDLGRYRREPA